MISCKKVYISRVKSKKIIKKEKTVTFFYGF